MDKLKLKCPCGKVFKSKKTVGSSYSVGDVRKESGWYPVFISDGGLQWLCPGCAHRVEILATEIRDIIDDENIYFPGLLRDKK